MYIAEIVHIPIHFQIKTRPGLGKTLPVAGVTVSWLSLSCSELLATLDAKFEVAELIVTQSRQ